MNSALLLGALVLMVVALLDLRFGKVSRQVPQRGIEVVFVLDVSRSMLAQDIRPNRLERAKQMIQDTLDALEGDSAGLVIFAGEAKQVIPVMNHRSEFHQRLASVATDDILRGGSRLGDAIRVARDAFLETSGDSRVIVILSDGEDMDSEPIPAARQAHEEHQITIFTIGLGDNTTGARIPARAGSNRLGSTDSYVKHDGKEVWSKLDQRVLEQIATNGGGAFIPAGTKRVEMDEFYRTYLDRLPETVLATREVDQYETRYQWFLAPSIFLLILRALRRKREP